ncbi:MAG: hypothetical protein AD742_19455 [Methylibium sp. NZG]|nr:MAG: hypothetical protein AD742_19455 [Methylibium sp. NZG]
MAVTEPYRHTPDRLTEVPPADRFCDVVLHGGVASGVVYPWALLKLARHYRFKNIGGNSVGAMAAAMAAAAEFGRCQGVEQPFEPLRLMPLKLAEEDACGRPKMLRLFQPSPKVRRLFKLFLAAVHWSEPGEDATEPHRPTLTRTLLFDYGGLPASIVLLLVWCASVWWALGAGWSLLPLAVFGLLGALVFALGLCVATLWSDLHRLAANGYGLCTGLGQGHGEEGLMEWLHKGIQRSAGREREDPPLTFADLWSATRFGQRGPAPLAEGLQPPDPGINLQMFTSNVTLGRPVRLPLNDGNTRLYYDPESWTGFFQPTVMQALEKASSPYRPRSASDPKPHAGTPEQQALKARLRELPSGGMPIVVAARLSLCFPLLFSCVPVYAVDYEELSEQRVLRRCLLSDGGLCTNFPIHLFDSAHPRWPTFGFLLDRRLKAHVNQDVWLPETNLQGRSDNWQRFVPGAEDTDEPERPLLRRLVGLLGGMLLTTLDWNDRVTGRLPHVRNRIIRLALKPGEGQLNLDMPGKRILSMAHRYGTEAGKVLVERYEPDASGVKTAWREHLYVRSMIELRALRRHLSGFSRAVKSHGSTVPLGDVLARATGNPAAPSRALQVAGNRDDPAGAALSPQQAQALSRAVQAVEALEAALSSGDFGPYEPVLEPELRLRPPV